MGNIKMDKKLAIKNTLLGKLQSRSSKLFEDVNNEIWDMQPKEVEKDYTLEIDGKPVEDEEPKETEVSAMDVILNNKPTFGE